MKNRIFIVAAILALLATACKKENPQNDLAVTPITISASYGVNDGAKVSYTEDGNTITATWDAGDQLYVVYNNHVNTLMLSAGAGTASATFTGSIVGTPTATSPLFCYVRDANNPSAVTVSPTGEYTYASGAFLTQDGTLASAAKCNLFYGATTYGNGTNISCTFSPNTSMLKLTVSAPAGVLAGATATLTYKSATTDLAKATFTVGANGKNTIYLTVPAGEYTGEQTLVYHSGEANVTETLSDTQATFAAGQTYGRKVYFGSSIPDGAVDGMFTINASGNKVYFSEGNLQYKDGEGWRFAEHQYDCVGAWSTSNWVDLYLWGTWSEGQNPLLSSSASFSWSSDFDGTLTNASSSDGWRILSSDEWTYVYSTRSTTSGIRFAKAIVNNINGIILLPDNWNSSVYSLYYTNTNNAAYSSNTISADDWADTFEFNGAVFLPAAGRRWQTSLYDMGSVGRYWTATHGDSNNKFFEFTNSLVQIYNNSDSNNGNSIRLVCPAD